MILMANEKCTVKFIMDFHKTKPKTNFKYIPFAYNRLYDAETGKFSV